MQGRRPWSSFSLLLLDLTSLPTSPTAPHPHPFIVLFVEPPLRLSLVLGENKTWLEGTS